jgi:putative transposase
VVTPAAKRQVVVHVCTTHEVSERRACQVLGVDRSTVRYRSLRPDDGVVRLRIGSWRKRVAGLATGVCISC